MRQLCNVAYSIRAEGLSEAELGELDIMIGMAEDPAEDALAALREHQEAAGITFADPDAPVYAEPGAGGDESW